jgi:hypothetical protein
MSERGNSMNRKLWLGWIAALVLTTLACSVVDTTIGKLIGGSDNMTVVSQLWSDVPRMDGLTPSQMDMPLPIKLTARTIIGNLGRLNKEGEDKTTGNIDWIVFTSRQTPTDVMNFYTAARMKASGWETGDASPCVSGSETGIPQVGAFCVFQKTQNGKQAQLAILVAPDEQTKQTHIFFLRLEMTPSR